MGRRLRHSRGQAREGLTIEGLLVAPSPAEVHDQARRRGINLGDPRFTLLERAYTLPWSLNYPNVAEELTDWLIAVIRILESEPDTKLFPLVTRLASIAIDYSYETELDHPATTSLTAALHDAFTLLRYGTDKHEARAAFVMALVRATKHLP